MEPNTAAAIAHLQAALELLQPVDDAPSVKASYRVETVGRVAHLHLKFLEEHGAMTVHDSREIRRELAGSTAKTRSTANLFGRKNSGAILYRAVDHGTPVKANQIVHLTDEGVKLAKLYRAA